MEDWALIRRLVADGVPQRQVARDLGIGRSTVERALASDRPPKYERPPVPTSFEPFEPLVGDQAVAAAMIDRVVHHADVLTLKGASYRLRNRGIDTLPSIRTQDTAD
ncbi:MAG: helix-turn-helix domain-containing protein [Tetrasphaera sp.]|nr:helix-turn-helix domain-containing protein [Tetrasphaera sp.]